MAEADTTFPIPSENEVFVDRYRRITPKWYPWIKRLFENLRVTKTAVKSLEETVDGVNEVVDNVRGTWAITVNQNNRITAFAKIDGTAASSKFSVMADAFEIVHPFVNNSTITAFVVSTVNGIPTVGINGNLIVDDTINANALNVSALSAITANLGFVTAGLMISPDNKFIIDLTNKYIRISS